MQRRSRASAHLRHGFRIISIAWCFFRSTAAARRGLFRLNGLLARATNAARACGGGGLWGVAVSGQTRIHWESSPACPARSFQTQIQNITFAVVRSVRGDTTHVAACMDAHAAFCYARAMIPSLETPRLWLQPLELADAEQIQQIFPQWEIVKHLTSQIPWPYPPDGALGYYRDLALPAMERGEQWHWTLRPKTKPETIIGAIALFRDGETNRGFWLDPAWQRQGLTTEAAEAVTHFWFEVLRMPTLRTSKAIANLGSRRISEKTGMKLIETKDADYVSGRLPTEVWEITADEWRAQKLRAPHTV